MPKLIKILLLILLLSGCASNEVSVATPIPTPDVWRVAYSSELGWLVPMFRDCLGADSRAGIVVEESQTMQLAGMQADIMLHWGEVDPQNFPAYHLGDDGIVMIVNSANPLESISNQTILQIYRGEITDWSDISSEYSGTIQAWVYADHLPIQKIFTKQAMKEAAKRPSFNIAPDVEAMLEAIRDDPVGIGFIPGLWQDSSVHRLAWRDGAAFSVPVVLISTKELDQEELSWLDCLQKQIPKE
jgi:hypothetical protein